MLLRNFPEAGAWVQRARPVPVPAELLPAACRPGRAVSGGPVRGRAPDCRAPGAWQRLEALPDPRSPQGRIYPLACLVAVAVCAFTAAGNDRFTAVGQWIKRAGQADLARLRAPWDPVAGRYRAPDEKTIRIVLDRLDPRALTRALLGPRPRRRRGGPSPASVRRYRARRAARQAQALARDRLRAVAVDGKTSRGARRFSPSGPDSTTRAATRDNAIAGMPHLVHVDLRDLHDHVACPYLQLAQIPPHHRILHKTG